MPRSPSRDVVDRFTGNRGYFHRADPLRRWKNNVAIGAVFLVLGWLFVEFAMGERAANAHTHGELANPHAAFDSNCQACHKEHSTGDFLSNPLSLFRTEDRWHDLTCTKCHAGPAHHGSAQDKSFHDRCSNCHHDHNGRVFSLVKMDDSHCVNCHADLPMANQKAVSPFASAITGFSKDHPDFQSLKIERGLKFSHGLHMTPGLVYSANDQHKLTPEALEKKYPATKDRYPSAEGLVQLQCVSCHQLDSGRTPPDDVAGLREFEKKLELLPGASRNSILPPRAGGAYYLPVNFDLHCKSCHPLKTMTAASNGVVIEELFVPHRRQTEALRPLLRGLFATHLTAKKHPLLAMPVGPDGRLDPAANKELALFGAELNKLTENALGAVSATCTKCHDSAATGKADVRPLPDKSVWLEHATFNHVSHRGLTCASCHPGTEASFTLNEREPPLIAGVKSCQTCHAPTSEGGAGVRHSCVDCHRYHNGDRPLQGLGSPHRDPTDPLSLDAFLSGGKKQP